MISNPGYCAEYQQELALSRSSPYVRYPIHVSFETLALCSAACGFCPYPTLTRKGQRMDDALLDKIMTELEDIPRELPFMLSPFKVNEPFLDTRLQALLQRANRRLPNALLALTSNASPLTEKRLLELAEIRNVSYLWLSINETDPEAYTRVMRLPWKLTESRLNLIHQLKALGRLPFRVVLSRVGDGSPADPAFLQWVGRHFPLFEASVSERGNWLGQVNTPTAAEIPDFGCNRWFELSITSTGRVAHCCMDGEAEWSWGDVSRTHLLEVYNQPAFLRLREQSISRREVEPCNRCTFL